MSLKSVEKFVNQIPWLPDDIKIILKKNSTQFKPKKETAKYDESLYNKLCDIICGAKYYDLFLEEEKSNGTKKK